MLYLVVALLCSYSLHGAQQELTLSGIEELSLEQEPSQKEVVSLIQEILKIRMAANQKEMDAVIDDTDSLIQLAGLMSRIITIQRETKNPVIKELIQTYFTGLSNSSAEAIKPFDETEYRTYIACKKSKGLLTQFYGNIRESWKQTQQLSVACNTVFNTPKEQEHDDGFIVKTLLESPAYQLAAKAACEIVRERADDFQKKWFLLMFHPALTFVTQKNITYADYFQQQESIPAKLFAGHIPSLAELFRTIKRVYDARKTLQTVTIQNPEDTKIVSLLTQISGDYQTLSSLQKKISHDSESSSRLALDNVLCTALPSFIPTMNADRAK